jgi:hypothetical protein
VQFWVVVRVRVLGLVPALVLVMGLVLGLVLPHHMPQKKG